MAGMSYNRLLVKGPTEELKRFEESFKGHCAYYWVEEEDFKPYPMDPDPFAMDGPALKGETCEQYNLRMEELASKGEKTCCFNALYPVPDEIRRKGYDPRKNRSSIATMEEKSESGYRWQVDNWGTKWEMIEPVIFEESDKYAVYEFSTAWNIPEEWLLFISSQYPSLIFGIAYENDGGFLGVSHFVKGKHKIQVTSSNYNDPNHFILYAHIMVAYRCEDGKFNNKTIQDRIETLGEYYGLDWVSDYYNKIKVIDPDDVECLISTGKMINQYFDIVLQAFGNAAISIFDNKKKEIDKMEKDINTIRLDIRGSHLKLVVA